MENHKEQNVINLILVIITILAISGFILMASPKDNMSIQSTPIPTNLTEEEYDEILFGTPEPGVVIDVVFATPTR